MLLSIFAADILPVFLIASVGFLLARVYHVQVSTVARVVFYAAVPCLVFTALVHSTIDARGVGRMLLFHLSVTSLAGALAWMVSGRLGLTRPMRLAFLLVIVFSNGGNYGLPVALFAFGPDALPWATIYFCTGVVLTYTVGIFLAASGRRSAREAFLGVFKVPTIYGILAALGVLATGTTVPLPVARPIELLSQAAVPMMILVLGMQFERASWPERPGAVAVAIVLSLVVTPLIGLGVAKAIGLAGAARQAAVLQTAMPAAVVTTILALEFDTAPSFVTSVVVASTALSPLTLTWLISWLQRT